MTRDAEEYVVQFHSWVREKQARIAEVESGIACSKVVIRENKVQLKIHKRQLRSALADFLKWKNEAEVKK